MPTSNLFREPCRLGHLVEHLTELPSWSWLYIGADQTAITLDTLCLPTATDSRDMSEEEIQEFEAHAQSNGLRAFFCRDQLQDIIENLRRQRAEFTPQQLAVAIDYYWRRDAFIDLSTPAGQAS